MYRSTVGVIDAKCHFEEPNGGGTETDGDYLLELLWKVVVYEDLKENRNIFAVLGISHLNLISHHAKHGIFCVECHLPECFFKAPSVLQLGCTLTDVERMFVSWMLMWK